MYGTVSNVLNCTRLTIFGNHLRLSDILDGVLRIFILTEAYSMRAMEGLGKYRICSATIRYIMRESAMWEKDIDIEMYTADHG